ncbi:MAG: Ldh family oxidoreductase [Candidatus Latescibacteria bacterium]|jgi:hydroxycarboxylate dehydrogenase B|nr:Ldh family oxidoreductase [Candidatus Latescibacterota bacterium]
MQMHTYKPTYLHALTRRLFEVSGATNEVAHIVANILVGANLTGHDSHGVLRVPTYMHRISDGLMNAGTEPTVVRESLTTLVLDGHQGPGHLTAYRALNKAIEKARTSEICSVSFTQIEHIGRLGHYAEIAAREGFVGIAMVGRGAPNALKVLPFGGKKGSLGTNPIAIGIPTGDEVPFLLDIATSVVAEGKLQVARSKNVAVPENYIVDKNNVPTTDPHEFYDGGYLRTFGGHKGYAFSLAACLMGQLAGNFGEGCPFGYAFMQVININAFTDLTGYQGGIRAFLDNIKQSEPADGVDEVQVPGEFEHRNRIHRLKHGIEIPDTINEQLSEWADKFNVATDGSIIEEEDRAYYI